MKYYIQKTFKGSDGILRRKGGIQEIPDEVVKGLVSGEVKKEKETEPEKKGAK